MTALQRQTGFQRYPETEQLIKLLRQVAVGELASNEALSAAIGRPIQLHRHWLRTAVKALEEERYFFRALRGQGIIRVDDVGQLTKSTEARKSIRRKVTRTLRSLFYVDATELSPEHQTQYHLEKTILNLHTVLERPHIGHTMKTLCDAESQELRIHEAVQTLSQVLNK